MFIALDNTFSRLRRSPMLAPEEPDVYSYRFVRLCRLRRSLMFIA